MTAKLPGTDRRAAHIATTTELDREGLGEFLVGKHRWVLATTRRDGRPQLSLVTGGAVADGTLVTATYPSRAKVANVRRNPAVSVLVMGAEFNDPWVQVDGEAHVVDLPEAADVLVEYFRSISGEHPDWDEYRQAMVDQGKCAVVLTPTRWGPVATGGFPASLFEDQ